MYDWINSIDNAEFLKFKDEYKLQVRSLSPPVPASFALPCLAPSCLGYRCPCRCRLQPALLPFPPCSCSLLTCERIQPQDLSPAEWWAKIDEIAAQNAAKGA